MHVPFRERFRVKAKKQEAPIALRKVFDELGGTYLKLGQLLSLRPDLVPKEYCVECEKLLDQVSPVKFGMIKKQIENELGENKESWNWGAVHKYAFQHPLGEVKLLSYLFNPKPIPAAGDRETINRSYFGFKMPYDVTRIPSYRFIVDLADIDNAVSMNSTGQSGDPFSEHYSDQIESWTRVNYHPMLFDVESIEKNKRKELILNPE